MFDWFARQAFDSLWALIWHFGIITGVLILALAWTYFVPVGKRLAMLVALCSVVTLFTAAIYTKLGANYVQAKWDAAVKADLAAATAARAKAEASVPALVPDEPAPKLRHDAYDRDNATGNGSGVPSHHVLGIAGQRADSKTNPGPQCNGASPRALEITVRRRGYGPYRSIVTCRRDLAMLQTYAVQSPTPLTLACRR